MSREPAIRRATLEDAAELARLLALLGYPRSAEDVCATWEAWERQGNVALVVQGDGRLLGALTLHQMIVLHRERPVGRISSLVVDPQVRGRGLGRALVRAAEEALARAGCGLVEVTSHVRRAQAHAFYRHLGYEETSLRFAKGLQ